MPPIRPDSAPGLSETVPEAAKWSPPSPPSPEETSLTILWLCPCKVRGVPIPATFLMSTARLYPQAWINNRFRMLAWPRQCTRRIPPVSYVRALDCSPSAPAAARFPSALPVHALPAGRDRLFDRFLAVPVARLPLRLRHMRLLPARRWERVGVVAPTLLMPDKRNEEIAALSRSRPCSSGKGKSARQFV